MSIASILIIVAIAIGVIVGGTLIGVALEMRDYRRNRSPGDFLEDVLLQKSLREGNDTPWKRSRGSGPQFVGRTQD